MSPSDALFGADGTESPKPMPDPWSGSGHGSWRDEARLPPFVLPSLPDTGIDWATVAAAYREDAGATVEAVGQDPAVAPAEKAPTGGSPVPGTADRSSPHPPPAPPPTPPALSSTVPIPPVPIPPVLVHSTPSQPRRFAGSRHRPFPVQPRESTAPADPRRWIPRGRAGSPLRSSSIGSMVIILLAIWTTIALLIYFIITNLLNSLSHLLP